MDEKTIRIIPFTGEKEKSRMCPGKFVERAAIKRYYFILTYAKEILADESDKTKKK